MEPAVVLPGGRSRAGLAAGLIGGFRLRGAAAAEKHITRPAKGEDEENDDFDALEEIHRRTGMLAQIAAGSCGLMGGRPGSRAVIFGPDEKEARLLPQK